MKKVFFSSTVFDLIDVRSEIEAELRDVGLVPVLSGSVTADFQVQPDRNSIETCLVNLRASDVVIVVLCQRYGPVLKSAGFPDVSATHAEYLEAKEAHKPLYVYVRDRLDADYQLWRRNKKDSGLSFAWIRNEQDIRLFELIDAHRKLAAKDRRSNWYDVFRDSRELKAIVRRDLRSVAGRAELETLIRENRVPIVRMDVGLHGGSSTYFDCTFTNVGSVAAFNVSWRWEMDEGEPDKFGTPIPVMAPGQESQQLVRVHPQSAADEFITVQYQMAQGHWIKDRHRLRIRLLGTNALFGSWPIQRVYR